MTDRTKVLLDQASKQERAGEWSTAFASYEEAFRSCVASRDAEALMEVVTSFGHCYRQAGMTELAEEYLELALTLGNMQDDPEIAGRALNGLAILMHERGDIATAERFYRTAREYALQSGNKRRVGEVEQNLGILANIQGNFADALARYQEGLKYLEAAGDERSCAAVLNNLGMLHVDLDRLDEADVYFQRALQICHRLSDVVAAGIVESNRVELFLAQGHADRARSSCDEAFEIASRLNDDSGKAEALKYYGIIYRETGKPHLAEIHLREAIETASPQNPLVEAEAQRELALVLRAQQRNREALTALNRSHALFKRLQAQHEQADVSQRITTLEQDFLSLVRGWGESIEAKDRYTSGHCQRVADYACRIAEEAGISPGEMTWFRMGAFLHDVGKTEVPAEILNKPGRLTDEERFVMERHTVIGDDILAPVEFPWDIRPMVRSHHERWDGRGYPDRLAGEAIPFTARILRIADIFDALTTARSYRKPLTAEEALQIMVEDEGSFDPNLFGIFQALFPEFAERARQVHVVAGEEVHSAGA